MMRWLALVLCLVSAGAEAQTYGTPFLGLQQGTTTPNWAIYDGSQWVAIGQLDTLTHTLQLYNSPTAGNAATLQNGTWQAPSFCIGCTTPVAGTFSTLTTPGASGSQATIGSGAAATSTPSSINFDSSYSSAAGGGTIGELKLDLFGGQGTYGLGVSSGLTALVGPTIGFYSGSTNLGTMAPSAGPLWTGFTSYGAVVTTSGGQTSVASAGTAGQVLTSNGGSAVPSFQPPPGAGAFTNFDGTQINPTGTSAASPGVMMGLGYTITPSHTGNVTFRIGGTIVNTGSPSAFCIAQLRYGTGTAPVNGAAATGTVVGPHNAAIQSVTNLNVGGNVSNLTYGTTYWFDMSVYSSSGGCALQAVTGGAVEQ